VAGKIDPALLPADRAGDLRPAETLATRSWAGLSLRTRSLDLPLLICHLYKLGGNLQLRAAIPGAVRGAVVSRDRSLVPGTDSLARQSPPGVVCSRSTCPSNRLIHQHRRRHGDEPLL